MLEYIARIKNKAMKNPCCLHEIKPAKKVTLINVHFLSGKMKGKTLSDLTVEEFGIVLNAMGNEQKQIEENN